MAESTTIRPLDPTVGGGYALLKDEGIDLVQQYASDIWTDYNEHDPGVTTLEQLCYALTELSYRAEFPMADLLIDERTGKIRTHRQALFLPKRILTCNPLTEDDYRKLIVDSVPEVANAWLAKSDAAVGGLYRIYLYVPPSSDGECLDADSKIIRKVRRIYAKHRGLCEDIEKDGIVILDPLRTRVKATVDIGDTLEPEEILAGILFRAGKFLAPELRRRSLKSLIEAGESSDQIFDGPLLENGFISSNQLQPKARKIAVQDLAAVMVASPGVLGAADLAVRVRGREKKYRGSNRIPVDRTEILHLDAFADLRTSGEKFRIKLIRKGIEVQPDRQIVARLLAKKWSAYRQTYPLAAQYDEYLGIPEGQIRDLESYYSIQNQIPRVYGIGEYGLPSDATEARRGQAKQFKGYLLPFEQLLANYFSQLANARELFSISRSLCHTYFFQYLTDSVPNIEPLLKKEDGRCGVLSTAAGWVGSCLDPCSCERGRSYLDCTIQAVEDCRHQLLVAFARCIGRSQIESETEESRPALARLEKLVDSLVSCPRSGRKPLIEKCLDLTEPSDGNLSMSGERRWRCLPLREAACSLQMALDECLAQFTESYKLEVDACLKKCQRTLESAHRRCMKRCLGSLGHPDETGREADACRRRCQRKCRILAEAVKRVEQCRDRCRGKQGEAYLDCIENQVFKCQLSLIKDFCGCISRCFRDWEGQLPDKSIEAFTQCLEEFRDLGQSPGEGSVAVRARQLESRLEECWKALRCEDKDRFAGWRVRCLPLLQAVLCLELCAVECPQNAYRVYSQCISSRVSKIAKQLNAAYLRCLKKSGSLYERGLARIVHGQDPAIFRRNRFLDFLLALYGEKLDRGSIWDNGDDDSGEALIEAKIALLSHLVASTKNRGRGFDYLASRSHTNIAGLVIKSRIQLGMQGWWNIENLNGCLDDESAVGPDARESDSGESDFGDSCDSKEQLYVIEHTLLRFAKSTESKSAQTDDFDYSFTASVVVDAPIWRHDDQFRDFADSIIRQNMPAHLANRTYFLRDSGEFLPLYQNWREALQCRFTNPDNLPGACADLRDFLTRCDNFNRGRQTPSG